jgi:hypothetical protein
VIEIASNDGSLLKCFKKFRAKTLGIEPAQNIADMARTSGVETVTQFFNSSTAQQIRDSYGCAKAVIGNNVLAHVDDTVDFLAGCKTLLDKEGLVIIEVPYLCDLLDKLEYDTIYHEHLCYFSVNTLLRLCDTVGLCIVRMDHVEVHGGSLRMYAGRTDEYGDHSQSVEAWAQRECAMGLTSLERFQRFALDVKANRQSLLRLVGDLSGNGHKIAGYGAPAKSTTLLNYCGIGTSHLAYVVDKSPLKVGLYTPGMHIPVLPVSTLLERQPDYVLILAWNFAEEIMKQQQEYTARGGRFIIPIPEPRVV